MKVPWLTGDDIEEAARVTRERALAAGVPDALPFDVESTVEFALGFALHLDVDDLPPGVLGSTDFAARVVQVSSAVTAHTARLRFTVAHEVGHVVLHAALLAGRDALPTLFDVGALEPVRDARLERQADAFAGALLVPRAAVERRYLGTGLAERQFVVEDACVTFGVSRAAARIRLEALGVIRTRPPARRLL